MHCCIYESCGEKRKLAGMKMVVRGAVYHLERLVLHSVAEQKGCFRHWGGMGDGLQYWTSAAWQGD